MEASSISSAAEGQVRQYLLGSDVLPGVLTHVNRAVISDQHIERRHHANHGRETLSIPSTKVRVVEECDIGWCSWSHHPQWDNDGEDAA